MSTQITFQGQNLDVALMSSSQLVELFNQTAKITGKNIVKKFADKQTAIKRVVAAVQEAAAKAPAKGTTAVRKVRGMRFVFPQNDDLKKVRPGTMRFILVQLMQREEGATFDQCLAATWGQDNKMDAETKRKTTYEAIRLIHYYVGYGMRQDADGAIHLFWNKK